VVIFIANIIMPYRKFTQTIKGKKYWCAQNIRTGQIIHYKSEEDRGRGLVMREVARKLRFVKK